MTGTAPAVDAVRLSLHVLAAAIWVGGQLTVAGLLPAVRSLGEGAPRTVARAFARIMWPAYAVLLLTGVWNVTASHPSHHGGVWQAVLGFKIAVVLLAGVAAFVHQRATSRQGLAIWGALSGLSSLAALVLGVVLSG